MGLSNWLHPKTDSDAEEAGTQPRAQVRLIPTAPAPDPTPNFDGAVNDAMCLLMYAAEIGKKVDETTRTGVLRARGATSTGADDTVKANLLAALTTLAADLHPVTAESLRASCDSQTEPTIKPLRLWTRLLAVLIILSSAIAFVSSSLSSTVRTDIKTANELVVKLRAELGTESAPKGGAKGRPLPAGLNEGDVITDLQQYASTIRAIDARARQLNWFVLKADWDPFAQYRWQDSPSIGAEDEELFTQRKQKLLGATQQTQLSQKQKNLLLNQIHQEGLSKKFQLTVGLPNMPEDLDHLTDTYLEVRSFAQDILDRVSVFYGAFTACLLPVLYALLGTCAYLLRSFEEDVRHKTFTPSSRATSAHFLVAVIGGTVVGLFGNFNITDGASISPLAIAFLVGYAVDVFFSFLEGLLQAFTKGKNVGAAPATT
jgi:hypothetical protein